ncbi:hypothetical protein LT493_39395 [Streptomyces tricolor]|nr:hypothetical protein [Streptomyces tricolor]
MAYVGSVDAFGRRLPLRAASMLLRVLRGDGRPGGTAPGAARRHLVRRLRGAVPEPAGCRWSTRWSTSPGPCWWRRSRRVSRWREPPRPTPPSPCATGPRRPARDTGPRRPARDTGPRRRAPGHRPACPAPAHQPVQRAPGTPARAGPARAAPVSRPG